MNAESVEVNVGNDTAMDTGEMDSGEANSGKGDDVDYNGGETHDGGIGSGGAGGREEENSQSYDGGINDDESQITRLARSSDGDTTWSKKLTIFLSLRMHKNQLTT